MKKYEVVIYDVTNIDDDEGYIKDSFDDRRDALRLALYINKQFGLSNSCK